MQSYHNRPCINLNTPKQNLKIKCAFLPCILNPTQKMITTNKTSVNVVKCHPGPDRK